MAGTYFVVSYEIVSFLVMLAITFYTCTKYSDTTAMNREFKRLVLSVTVFAAVDILACLSINYKTGVFYELLANSLYYLVAIGTNFSYLMYVRSYSHTEGRGAKRKKAASLALPVILVAIFLVNAFTEWLFFIDDDFSFQHGKFFIVLPLVASSFGIQAAALMGLYPQKFSNQQIVSLCIFTEGVIALPFVQSYILHRYEMGAFVYSIFVMLILLTIETPDDQALYTTIRELEELEHTLKIRVAEKTEESQEKQKSMDRLTMQMMYALAETIDAKDKYTSGHSARVARYSKMLAQKKGMSQDDCQKIFMMGILHDIGKVGIPNKIINKPGKLTDQEFAIIKSHPAIGSIILEKVTMLPALRTGARWHHERIDGRGYPDGLKGEQIPLEAKIIAVADAYDAMTSIRSYRPIMEQEKVREQIVNGMGSQFDNEIATLMIELIDADTEYRMHEYKAVPNVEDL